MSKWHKLPPQIWWLIVPVVFHDKHLGRATNVAEHMGRAGTKDDHGRILNSSDVYSPFTGKGFSPHTETLDWNGCVEHLKLKDECGRIW